jgi:hypothetical protein
MMILSPELYSHFIVYTKRRELENTTEDTKASEDNKDGTKSNTCAMGMYKTANITHAATSAMHSPKKRKKHGRQEKWSQPCEVCSCPQLENERVVLLPV